MTVRCPEGHLSESQDYCDTCGSPIGPAPSASPTGPEEPAPRDLGPEPQTCPHCGALNVADALFCEACGYDFTTGTPPLGSVPAPVEEPDDERYEVAPATPDEAPAEELAGDGDTEGPPADEDDGEEFVGDEEVEVEVEDDEVEDDEDVEVEASDDGPQDAGDGAEDEDEAVEADGEETEAVEADGEETEAEATETPPAEVGAAQAPGAGDDAAGAEAPSPAPAPAAPAPTPQRRARHTPPSRALAEAWVVEVWVDPDWYAVQQTEETLPSPGVPDVVLLTRSTALVGRPSGSLGARPEVDAGADSAVSRRHAQLTSDGRRWWIEDLDSSNGTFVGTVGEPLPVAPITPGQKVEIDRDDRIYLGAWTRLVLRQATASEQRGTG